MDDSYRDIYAATFGATFARLVIDRSFEGFDPPDAYEARKLAEEADSVAHMAVEALDAYLHEKIEDARGAREAENALDAFLREKMAEAGKGEE